MTTRRKKAIKAASPKSKKKAVVSALSASAREPLSKPRKDQITLRLDIDIIDFFRAMGDGYQAKMNDLLGVAAGYAQQRTASEPEELPWEEENTTHKAMSARTYRPKKEQLTLRVDAETIEFFRAQGKGYQSKMNYVLRQMMVELIRSKELEDSKKR